MSSNPTAALFELNGQVAVVTGATGRLGREMAFALNDMGANLVLIARNKGPLQTLRSELSTQRRESDALVLSMDFQSESEIEKAFSDIQSHFGRLDILINNITGNTAEPVETLSEVTWDQTLHNIVTGMFLCCQKAGQLMTQQGKGNIINIASVYGLVAADQRIYGDSGLNSSVAYGTGKAAVLQLTRYLAAYWARHNIRVNAITPGGVEDPTNAHTEFRQNYTGRTPMERMMRREEIRGPLIFLASKASSYVTGHNLVVDGGFTII